MDFSYMFKRDCKDCIHFNPKRLKDENEHHCLLWLRCTASLGCSEYKLKQQSETGNLLENYTVKKVEGVEPIISYNGNIFLSVEELHQWKIEHMWNGIDIAVYEKDILR